MTSFDLESLLDPVSAVEPSGPDLEYDSYSAELDAAIKGKPEQQYGETIIEAEEPDWKSACRLASELLIRTKDIRIAIHLANACLGAGDFFGFRDVTRLLRDYVASYWDSVHPTLDADDDNDPAGRVNAIASLRNPSRTIRLLQYVTLLNVSGLGPICLRDIQIAKGQVADSGAEEPLITFAAIEGAFQNCDLDTLDALALAANSMDENLRAIESTITERVDTSQAVSLEPVTDMTKELYQFLSGHLQRRQIAAGPEVASQFNGGSSGE